jgi:rhodanese-related sulfurtransferase
VAAPRDTYLGEPTEAINRDELLHWLKTGPVVVLDVRPAEEYTAGHIAGAISIQLDQIADRLGDLPADIEVVTYCSGTYCVLAHDAVRLLTPHGRRAVRLAEGMLEWRLADLPIEARTM